MGVYQSELKQGLVNSKMASYLDDTKFGSRRSDRPKSLTRILQLQYPQKQVRAYSDLYRDAVKLMKSDDLNAFDITQEPESMTELYGASNFWTRCSSQEDSIVKVRYVEAPAEVGIHTTTISMRLQITVKISTKH